MSGSVEVGDEHLEAVPVDVGEGELRAGMWVFATHDHPGAVGPARQVDQVGDLGDLGVVAFIGAVGGDRRHATSCSARKYRQFGSVR